MKFAIALAAALTLGSITTFAADSSQPAPDSAAAPAAAGTKHGVCAADIEKFCAGIERGKGKIKECLLQHTADITDACKQRMADHAKPAAN